MGSVFSYIIKKLFRSSKELKLMIVGLDSSGKSSILSKIKGTMGIPETKPTIGYDLEEVKFKKVSLKVWDLSGQEKLRELWKHYYESVDAVIFVIDAANKTRIADAKEELYRMISCQTSKNVKVLVFANKQDLAGALSAKQLIEALGINEIKSICVSVRECSVYKNTGLVEGFTWLVDELNKKS